MPTRRGGLAVKFFSAVSIGVIQKLSLQNFMGKGLKALNNTTKKSPKATQNDSAETFKLRSFFEQVIVQVTPKTSVKK